MPAEYLPTRPRPATCCAAWSKRAKEQGIKGKAVYQPLRVALSARDEGPELFYLVGGLGQDRGILPPAGIAAAASYAGPLRRPDAVSDGRRAQTMARGSSRHRHASVRLHDLRRRRISSPATATT